MLKKFHHANVVVSDMERARTFYADVLGFEIADDITVDGPELSRGFGVSDVKVRAVFWNTPGGKTQIEMIEYLHPETRARETGWVPNTIGLGHFAFETDDIDAEYERLRAAGVEFVSEPVTVPTGARFCWFYDPDGNTLEIIQVP